MLNDVWGCADPKLERRRQELELRLVLMHNRSDPNNVHVRERLGGAYLGAAYLDLIKDVKRELMESVELARRARIEERIILDPGIARKDTRTEPAATHQPAG
jgi:dihydropteroate synthase